MIPTRRTQCGPPATCRAARSGSPDRSGTRCRLRKKDRVCSNVRNKKKLFSIYAFDNCI